MRPLGTPRRRWEGIIKMDLEENGCQTMDWIHGNEPSLSIKGWEFLYYFS
jgi:hypothetical protein